MGMVPDLTNVGKGGFCRLKLADTQLAVWMET